MEEFHIGASYGKLVGKSQSTSIKKKSKTEAGTNEESILMASVIFIGVAVGAICCKIRQH